MKKKILAIILSSIVVIFGGVTSAIVVVNNRPETVVAKSLQGVVQEFGERQEFSTLVKTFNGGSIEFKKSDESDLNLLGLNNFKISGKLYFGNEEFLLSNFKVSNEETDFNLNADLYVSNEKFYIKESKILKDTIGFNKGELTSSLERSIFKYNSGSDYALSKDLYQIVYNLAKYYDTVDNKPAQKELKKILREYVKELYDLICEYADFDSDKEKIRLNGERVDVRAITVTVDNEDFADILENFYEYIKNDDKILDYFDNYFGTSSRVVLENGKIDFNSVSELLESAIDNMEEDVLTYCDYLRDKAEWEYQLKIITPKHSSDLLKISLISDVDNEREEVFSLDFGKDGIKKTKQMSLCVYGEELVYEITSDNDEKFEANLTIDGDEIFNISLDRDRGKYVAEIEDLLVIKGKLYKDDSIVNFSIDTLVDLDFEEEFKIGWEFVLNEKDKIPELETKITTIDRLTEGKINGWIESIGLV